MAEAVATPDGETTLLLMLTLLHGPMWSRQSVHFEERMLLLPHWQFLG